jgi:hypothetical protein
LDFLADFDKKDIEKKGESEIIQTLSGTWSFLKANLGKVEVEGGKVFEKAVMVQLRHPLSSNYS